MSMLLMGVGGAESGGFSPLSLSPALWLKADAGTFLTSGGGTAAVDDGDPVGRWEDQSTNGRHVTQATSTKRGTLKLAIQNGLPVVRFDGVDDFLQAAAFAAALAQPNTIFIVAKPGGVGNKVLHSGGALTQRHYLDVRRSGTSDSMFAGIQVNVAVSSNAWHLWDNVYNTTASKASRDNSADATVSVGTQDMNGFTVGADFDGSAPLECDVAEVLVYHVALSDPQRLQVRLYLNTRWAVY